MPLDPKQLEKEAHENLTQAKYDAAYGLFIRAARACQERGEHKEAALLFASAAGSWNLKLGEKSFLNSASAYEEAALEAERSHDLEYASLLYRYAAISYERDMDFMGFSECFYRFKECYRRFLMQSLFFPGRIRHIAATQEKHGMLTAVKRLFKWLAYSASFFIWGHGERPLRTLYSAIGLVLSCALIYTQSTLKSAGGLFHPDFFEAVYFSAVTFTTVGFGDITPAGWAKMVAIFEAFCGIFVMPIFIVALSRKYLRL
ncbi:MAG: two pore domain potassium channel family protein [Candidatus Omnitrophica bacterium]|nr:two pore domain potassium channel family protein [Candidatus Omnitrophota bacterium]